MEENLDKLFDYRPLIPGSGRFASIVGIGGGAGVYLPYIMKIIKRKKCMEENLDKLFDYRPLIPGSGRFASIVGIGGGAGRVVDQMRKCCLPDVQLYAFGMNRKEMDELSLCGKYLIGQEGLGSGKDR